MLKQLLGMLSKMELESSIKRNYKKFYYPGTLDTTNIHLLLDN